MSKELERLLESVARSIVDDDVRAPYCCDHTPPAVAEVLKRRLLPLLKAGHRQYLADKGCGNVNHLDSNALYVAALREAGKEKP